jgi:hypothetical protein
MEPLKVGAVMYDPKVSVIWQIIRDFFESQGCPIDVAFYSTYEMQVTALLDGTLDIAWNSPLAWLDALFAMQYNNPAHREMMDLEGLKAWLPGRTSGFGPLAAAVVSERFFERPGSS